MQQVFVCVYTHNQLLEFVWVGHRAIYAGHMEIYPGHKVIYAGHEAILLRANLVIDFGYSLASAKSNNSSVVSLMRTIRRIRTAGHHE